MSDQKLNYTAHDSDTKNSAFDTIMLNSINEGLSDSEFRTFVKTTWIDKMLPKDKETK